MKAVIYTRTLPKNRRAAKPDSLVGQERRCRKMARSISSGVDRIFSDIGEIDPTRYPRGLQNLIYFLQIQKERWLVLIDHPARLGLTTELREQVKADIEATGARVVSLHANTVTWISLYEEEYLKARAQKEGE